jgi:3D (Asp-Asp-Asp) domain-containing protein
MSVLVGATSVDEAINGIENLHRIAGLDRQVIEAAKDARARLLAATRRLATEEAEARETADATAATVAALEAAQQEQAASLASLHAQRDANSSKISTLEAQARELAAVPISAPGTSQSGRTLAVVATGYSLAGNTSTGVPVGYGIVAVDPSVIALGTKMTIPGYGEGVAADTGGAIAGAHIDLWFPTEAEALAWGSRTVTVTLH